MAKHPKTEEGNTRHVGAPTPGTIVTVAVEPGRRVEKGATLPSLEAMKMESVLLAERDSVVKTVYVKPGDTVSAKGLLAEFD